MATTNGTGVEPQTREDRSQRHRDARVEHVRKRAKHDRLITEFQPDAVEIEHRKVPGGARWTLYVVTALIVAFVAWSYWAQVDQIVVGQGQLITTENTVVVQSFSPAQIKSLEVKFGDRVRAGQVVATLDPTFSDADLNQLNARKNSAMASRTRLLAELEGQTFSVSGHDTDRDWITQRVLFNERQQEMAAEMRRSEAEESKIDLELSKTEIDIDFRAKAIPSLKRYYDAQAQLWKDKRTAVTDFESAKINYLNAQKDLAFAKNQISVLKADKMVIQKQRDAFVANRRSAIADEFSEANQELTGVEQEINKAMWMDQQLELRVPTDSGHDEFVVFEVAERSVGSVLQKGEAVFKLIPIDVPLEAEIEISGRDVAKLRTLSSAPADGKFANGSKVTLKLGAFDYQDHGTLSGFVRTVSEGVYEPQNQQGGGGQAANFKARIKIIEPAMLENVPSDFRLMPGMSTTAEIKVGRRRVIHYFLYPLLRYLDEGFREP